MVIYKVYVFVFP